MRLTPGLLFLSLAALFHLSAASSNAENVQPVPAARYSALFPVSVGLATGPSAGPIRTVGAAILATATPDPGASTDPQVEDSLWFGCSCCCTPRHLFANMVLAFIAMLLNAFIVEHVLSSLANRANSRKLEPALSARFSDNGLDQLAYSCSLYKKAAIAPVIGAIIAEAKSGHSNVLLRTERLKQAWRAAGRIELAKSEKVRKYLLYMAAASLLIPAACVSSDLVTGLDDLSQAGSTDPIALFLGLDQGLFLLWFGLLLFVFSVAFERILLIRTKRLELAINQVAIDLIVSLLGGSARRPVCRYRPGIWMATDSERRRLRRSVPAKA